MNALAACVLAGTLALASIAHAECVDNEQASKDWAHLVEGALPCNNGKGVEVGPDGPIRAKPTPDEKKTLNWLTAHPDLPQSTKDRIRDKTQRASCQRGAEAMFPPGKQRDEQYRSCMTLKGY